MNKKTIIFILIICLLSAILLTACGSQKTVQKIQVIELQNSYQLDEKLNLDNARILVTHSDGTTTVVKITKAMVAGFDSSISGSQKSMTISYNGVSVKYSYTVSANINVDTPFRLTLSMSSSQDNVLIIKSTNVENIQNGVYAIKFDVTLSGYELGIISLMIGEKYKIEHLYNAGVLSVVIYDRTGDTPLTKSGDMVKITLLPTRAENKKITISNISMSDGVKDYTIIPTHTLII